MARGWESKAVEQQQDEAARRERRAHRPVAEVERQRQQERETLRMARSLTRAELARATREAHRAMLGERLAAIERRLAALDQ